MDLPHLHLHFHKETRDTIYTKWLNKKGPRHLQSVSLATRAGQGRGDCTFFADRVELGFEVAIAKILFATLDDKGRVYRVARHAEDERLGLRRRQLLFHAPSKAHAKHIENTINLPQSSIIDPTGRPFTFRLFSRVKRLSLHFYLSLQTV